MLLWQVIYQTEYGLDARRRDCLGILIWDIQCVKCGQRGSKLASRASARLMRTEEVVQLSDDHPDTVDRDGRTCVVSHIASGVSPNSV